VLAEVYKRRITNVSCDNNVMERGIDKWWGEGDTEGNMKMERENNGEAQQNFRNELVA